MISVICSIYAYTPFTGHFGCWTFEEGVASGEENSQLSKTSHLLMPINTLQFLPNPPKVIEGFCFDPWHIKMVQFLTKLI